MKFLLLSSNSQLLTYIIAGIVFLVLYFILVSKFAFKKAGTVKKLFLSVVPFTLVFIAFIAIFFTMSVNGLYASIYTANMGAIGGILNSATTNYNPTNVQTQIGGLFNNGAGNINAFMFSNGLIWFILAVVIYLLALITIFAIILKPLKEIENSTKVLSTGAKLENLKMKGRNFGAIKENLIATQNYILSVQNEIQRIRADYSRVIPKQAIQLMGKKDISEITVNQNVSRQCYIISIRNKKSCGMIEEDLSKINKIYSLISPIIRNYNGTIFSYALLNTNCVFISKKSCMDCLSDIKKVMSQNNIDSQVEMQSKMLTIGIVGYPKQYSFELYF